MRTFDPGTIFGYVLDGAPHVRPYVQKSFEVISMYEIADIETTRTLLTLSYIVRFTVNPVCAKLHTYNSRTH
jgi:hypothetical protein